MGLNDIVFQLGQGGLGRPLPGQDYISGLIFYTGTLPSGFSSTNRIKQIFSVADAEALGIKDNYADATAATGSIAMTVAGANGDTITISVKGLFGVVINLGTYTKSAGEANTTAVAAAIAAIINAGTNVHGFTAVALTGTVTITAPKSFGVFLNAGSPIVTAISVGGTIAGTITQFSGGVSSLQAVWHYHISEYFRVQPKGVLYLGFFAVPGTYNFAEVTTLQSFAVGSVRQVGIYKDAAAMAANGGDLTALSTICKANVSVHKELIGLLGIDISAVSDLSTLYDLSLLSAELASIVISQDGAALGATLFLTYGKSITNLGALLGAVSLAKVSEDVAWPAKFNISNGIECDTIAFANGKLYSDPTITDSFLGILQDRRYVFLRKFPGFEGSYFNEDAAAVALTSDYAYISNNRTIQKATRGVYTSLVPALNSPIVLNADGTLSDPAIAYFQTLAETNLIQMVRDGELSAFEVVINPSQNVLSTSKLIITINLVPVGTARNIQVNIGFQVSIS